MKRSIIGFYRRLPFPVAVALARGKPSLAFYIQTPPRILLVKNYLGEFLVRVHTDSDVERRMLSKSYELDTQAIIARYVKPGQHVLDIGANVGAITLALAKAVGPQGRVDAFEPGPPIFAKLQENLRLNPWLTQVQAHKLGMADHEGELAWQESPSAPGNATIYWADANLPTTPVKITTIDMFAREKGLKALDFIKIDVEGMELQVLRGGLESLQRFQPILFFESSLADDEQKKAAQEIEGLLRDFGYRLYKVGSHGSVVETRYPNLSFETLALVPQHLAGG